MMKPHARSRSKRKGPIKPPPIAIPDSSFVTPGDVQIDQSETDTTETLQQLEKVVSEFMITYLSLSESRCYVWVQMY